MKYMGYLKYALILAFIISLACQKEEEPFPIDKNLVERITREPLDTQKDADSSDAALLYASMPQGAPITVEAEKSNPPVILGPLERIPFLGLVMALGRAGFRLLPDSTWGVWEFQDSVWVHTSYTFDSTVTLIWDAVDFLAVLKVENINIWQNQAIESADFYLMTPADSVNFDTLAYLYYSASLDAQGKPTSISAEYSILSVIYVSLYAQAYQPYTLRSREFVGYISSTVVNIWGDTLYVYTERNEDTSEFVSVDLWKNGALWFKNFNISPVFDSIPGYLYRNITGNVGKYEEETQEIRVAWLDGRIWHPEDESHKNYLYLIFEDGTRINLWK